MKKSPEIETTFTRKVTVLSLSADTADCVSLQRIFDDCDGTVNPDPKWTLIASHSLTSSFSVLRKRQIAVLLCECDMFPGTWREVLEYAALLSDPPLLVVTSRLADGRLWAEALNLGAYDVLAKPFDATEVTRTVYLASQHWLERHQLGAHRTGQKTAGTGTYGQSSVGRTANANHRFD